MTELTQVPFADLTFVDNPEPRCPCVLLLDTSSSMAGSSIDQLNAGLRQFQKELGNDALASQRVEVAVITFGPVKVVQDFITADHYAPTELIADGDTPIGACHHRGARTDPPAQAAVPGQRHCLLPALGVPHHRWCANGSLGGGRQSHQGRRTIKVVVILSRRR